MRRKIAVVVGAVAGAAILVSGAFIGIGVITSLQAMAAARQPVPTTVIGSGEPADAADPSPAPVVSVLPPAMIAGLPEYTATHDRDTYIRVQTWITLCMRDQAGYSYGFDPAPESGDVTGFVSTTFVPVPPEFDQHEQISLYGEPGNLLPAYDWEKGGCYGQALHKAGLLDDGATAFTAAELTEIADLYDSMTDPPERPWGYDGETPGFQTPVSLDVFERIDAAITACMAENGIAYAHDQYLDDNGNASLLNGAYDIQPLEGDPSPTFYEVDSMVALYGPHTSADQPYDWTRGGCYGRAVHEAGIPGAE